MKRHELLRMSIIAGVSIFINCLLIGYAVHWKSEFQNLSSKTSVENEWKQKYYGLLSVVNLDTKLIEFIDSSSNNFTITFREPCEGYTPNDDKYLKISAVYWSHQRSRRYTISGCGIDFISAIKRYKEQLQWIQEEEQFIANKRDKNRWEIEEEAARRGKEIKNAKN